MEKVIDINNFNTDIRPQHDFNQYSNGSWLKNNKIPDDYTQWGTFQELLENNYLQIKKIINNITHQNIDNLNCLEKKIDDFWNSGMNLSTNNNNSLDIINELFLQINNADTKYDLISVLGSLHKKGVPTFFIISSNPDSKNSELSVPYIYNNGLLLPDREYFLNIDKVQYLYKFESYIRDVNDLIELSSLDNDNLISGLIHLQKQLAEYNLSKQEQRDVKKTYNKMEYNDLKNLNLIFNWDIYLNKLNIPKNGYFIVDNLDYIKKIDQILDTTPREIINSYLKLAIIINYSPFIAGDFSDLHFSFFNKTLKGQKKQKPYWKRMIDWSNNVLGEILGQKYVENYFPENSKNEVLNIIDDIKDSFFIRLKNIDWMEDSTKLKAFEKFKKFNVKIGYPDKWRDYSNLNITSDSLLENIINSNQFEWNYQITKMYKPVDKNDWEMFPQTVNAYFNPELNEIVFPAGILQAPFFSIKFDYALNYGGIGAVIGHEITHGYDDQGHLYDENGNLNNWWSPSDEQKFKERCDLIINQFDRIELIGHKVNGNLTQGENIADLGGLIIAYHALINRLKKTDHTNLIINGFNQPQRFFLIWSRIWRNLIKDDELILRLTLDPHSPGELRINMPLSNMIEFYDTFHVKEGDTMYRPEDDRVNIW